MSNKEVVYKPASKPKEIYAGGGITPPKFMPNFVEWLIYHGDPVIKQSSRIVAGTSNFGSAVPQGFVFLITSISISTNATYAYVSADGGNTSLVYIHGGNLSLSFNYPLKVYPDQNITLTQSGAGSSNAVLHGFLVKNDNIPVL